MLAGHTFGYQMSVAVAAVNSLATKVHRGLSEVIVLSLAPHMCIPENNSHIAELYHHGYNFDLLYVKLRNPLCLDSFFI